MTGKAEREAAKRKVLWARSWNLGDKGANGQLYWRNDALFLVGSDAPSPDNPQGKREFGFGDMLSQAFWILPSDMTEYIPTDRRQLLQPGTAKDEADHGGQQGNGGQSQRERSPTAAWIV